MFFQLFWLVVKTHVKNRRGEDGTVDRGVSARLQRWSVPILGAPCWWISRPSVPCQTAGVLSSLSLWAMMSSFVNGQRDLCYKGVDGEPGRSPWCVGCPWQPIPSLLASGGAQPGLGPVGAGCSSTCREGPPNNGEEHSGFFSTRVPK